MLLSDLLSDSVKLYILHITTILKAASDFRWTNASSGGYLNGTPNHIYIITYLKLKLYYQTTRRLVVAKCCVNP